MENVPTERTFLLLQDKMANLEQDTRNLAKNLEIGLLEFEFDSFDESLCNSLNVNTCNNHVTVDEILHHDSITESQISLADANSLVSRVCRNESQLQTMKDVICSIMTVQNNKRKIEQKVPTCEESHIDTEKIEKFKNELQKSQKIVMEQDCEMKILREKIVDMEKNLKNMQTNEAQAHGTIEGLNIVNKKLDSRLKVLREEIAFEQSLRATLEQSQIALFDQIRETEIAMNSERDEVHKLTSACSAIRVEAALNLQELEMEREERRNVEQDCARLKGVLVERSNEVAENEEKSRVTDVEIKRLQTQYTTLNEQLVEMENITSQHIEVNKQLQTKNQKLKEALIHTALPMGDVLYDDLKLVPSQEIQKYEETKDELRLLKQQHEKVCKEREEESQTLTMELKDSQRENKFGVKEFKLEKLQLESKVNALESDNKQLKAIEEQLAVDHKKKINSLREEKLSIEDEFKMLQLEYNTMAESRSQLENEVMRLTNKIGTLEQNQGSRENIESTLHEITKQNQKLSFEKGQFEMRLSEFEREAQLGETIREEHEQTKKSLALLQKQYRKAHSECDSLALETKRHEGSISQLKAALNTKIDDLALLRQLHDDAISENLLLKDNMECIQQDNNEHESNLKQDLNLALQDKTRIEGTLQTMMSSNSQLQLAVERLNVELAHRDALVNQLKLEKLELIKNADLQTQKITEMKQYFQSLETTQENEVKSLRDCLDICRRDNIKMASALEELIQSNSSFQNTTNTLEIDLAKKSKLIEKLKKSKLAMGENMKSELEGYNNRITSLQLNLQTEKDKCDQNTSKESIDLRRQCDALSSKNGELSRSNLDLRNRLCDLEMTVKESKERNSSLKSQLDRVTGAKKKVDDKLSLMKTLKTRLENLESVKEDYVKKNRQQESAIKQLTDQIMCLQTDMKSLSQQQSLNESVISDRDRELDLVKEATSRLQIQYQEKCEEQSDIEKRRIEAEERLRDVANESSEISRHLSEAQNWFQSRFHNFEDHLMLYQEKQEMLEKENEESCVKLNEAKSRAKVTANRANKIIKASRVTMEHLVDHALTTDSRAKQNVQLLHHQLQKERDHSQYLEMKNTQIKESSGRQLESLAREINHQDDS